MTNPPDEAGKVVKRGRGVITIYQQSPFILDANAKVRRVSNKTGDRMLISKNTNDGLNDVAGFWQTEEVDATQFVKLFVQGVRALKELSSAGARMFELLYVLMQASPNKDLVNMAYWTIDQNVTPISESTHGRGMSELIQKGFIAATPQSGFYWINPNFLWNGDRLAFVKEYRRKPSTPDINRGNDQPALPFGDDPF